MNKQEVKNLLIQYPVKVELSHCDDTHNYYEAKIALPQQPIDEPLSIIFAVDCEHDVYDSESNAIDLIEWYSHYDLPAQESKPLPQLELNFN